MRYLVLIFSLTLISFSCSQSEFDCPDLELNIGDACELTFPDRPDVIIGNVKEECECSVSEDEREDDREVDCPDLGSNIGEPCRFVDASGATVEGTTTADCECE